MVKSKQCQYICKQGKFAQLFKTTKITFVTDSTTMQELGAGSVSSQALVLSLAEVR